MIEVLDYIIKAYEYGYVVYHRDKVAINKKDGSQYPTQPKYTGSIEGALKIVLRESVHDYVLESNESLTIDKVMRKIIDIEDTIDRLTVNA